MYLCVSINTFNHSSQSRIFIPILVNSVVSVYSKTGLCLLNKLLSGNYKKSVADIWEQILSCSKWKCNLIYSTPPPRVTKGPLRTQLKTEITVCTLGTIDSGECFSPARRAAGCFSSCSLFFSRISTSIWTTVNIQSSLSGNWTEVRPSRRFPAALYKSAGTGVA